MNAASTASSSVSGGGAGSSRSWFCNVGKPGDEGANQQLFCGLSHNHDIGVHVDDSRGQADSGETCSEPCDAIQDVVPVLRTVAQVDDEEVQDKADISFCGLATSPEFGVVDAAAQDGLIGKRALEALSS